MPRPASRSGTAFEKKACCKAERRQHVLLEGLEPGGDAVVALALHQGLERRQVAPEPRVEILPLLERLQQDELRLRRPQDAGVGPVDVLAVRLRDPGQPARQRGERARVLRAGRRRDVRRIGVLGRRADRGEQEQPQESDATRAAFTHGGCRSSARAASARARCRRRGTRGRRASGRSRAASPSPSLARARPRRARAPRRGPS